MAHSEHFVTPRRSPDLDGLACAVAYAELLQARGIPARPWISGAPDPEATYAVERLSISVQPCQPRLDSPVVLVDASDLRGMPQPLDPLNVVEVIDHRRHHRAAELFPNASLCIEAVGAAATLVAERFQSHGSAPSAPTARLLQAAIWSNTQALRGSITTDRDRAAVLVLQTIAPLADDFVTGQFHAKKLALTSDLAGAIDHERKDFDHPDGPYVLSQLEFLGARSFLDVCVPCVSALGPRTMLNVVDVEVAISWLLVPDAGFRAWVEGRTGLHFNGISAESPGILLRKQLVARLETGT